MIKKDKEVEKMNRVQKECLLLILIAGMEVLRPAGPCFAQSRISDPHYEPTPQLIVGDLLTMAELNPNDIVYDLGGGDGAM